MQHAVQRSPRQDRSKASLERMLDAAERLVVARGGDGFTLQDVAEAAEIAVGSISFRFGSKERLIRAAHKRALQRIVTDERAMVGDLLRSCANLNEFVVRYVATFADFLSLNGPMIRQVMRRASSDAEVARCGQEAARTGSELAQSAFLSFGAEIAGVRELKARTVFHTVFSALSRQLGLNIISEPAHFQDFEELKRELGIMALAYLKYHQ